MSAPTEGLSRIPGGLRLPPNKGMSTELPIVDVPVPPTLIIPLAQHVGEPALPTVQVGDQVHKGQLIGAADGAVSAPVHATAAGRVVEIAKHAIAARNEPLVQCVTLSTSSAAENDLSPAPAATDTGSLLRAIQTAGVVGLGGAVYPTAQKVTSGYQSGIHTVVLNGVECESYITCDDALMREHAADVVRGGCLLADLLGAERTVIAVESDKPAAITAVQHAIETCSDTRIDLVQIPTVYPSGGEDQLVLLLTGMEVPSGGLPSDLGILVQNVGTAAAVAAAVDRQEPLLSRIVTVTGEGINRPGNYRVRFGTPIAAVVQAAGGYNSYAKRLLIGGPMTGITLTDDAIPVTKACNCLLVTGPAVHLSTEPERACIRCGECASHCPVRLLPQSLHSAANRSDDQRLTRLGLNDCIECGCCDLVCPSHIPLTETFRQAKQHLALRSNEKMRAERAKARFEAHATRALEAEKLAEEDARATRASASSDAIAAIIARKKSRGPMS